MQSNKKEQNFDNQKDSKNQNSNLDKKPIISLYPKIPNIFMGETLDDGETSNTSLNNNSNTERCAYHRLLFSQLQSETQKAPDNDKYFPSLTQLYSSICQDFNVPNSITTATSEEIRTNQYNRYHYIWLQNESIAPITVGLYLNPACNAIFFVAVGHITPAYPIENVGWCGGHAILGDFHIAISGLDEDVFSSISFNFALVENTNMRAYTRRTAISEDIPIDENHITQNSLLAFRFLYQHISTHSQQNNIFPFEQEMFLQFLNSHLPESLLSIQTEESQETNSSQHTYNTLQTFYLPGITAQNESLNAHSTCMQSLIAELTHEIIEQITNTTFAMSYSPLIQN
jgi:hypothetical protein